MDEWVDRALSTYVPAEPPLGLERRILAHARAPRRKMAPWLAAAAVISTVCGIIALRPFAAIPDLPPAPLSLPAGARVPEARSLPQKSVVHRRPRRAVLPKLAVFPKPETAPEAEVMLARLALDPAVGKALLSQPELAEPEPIRIEPLSIKLLDED